MAFEVPVKRTYSGFKLKEFWEIVEENYCVLDIARILRGIAGSELMVGDTKQLPSEFFLRVHSIRM